MTTESRLETWWQSDGSTTCYIKMHSHNYANLGQGVYISRYNYEQCFRDRCTFGVSSYWFRRLLWYNITVEDQASLSPGSGISSNIGTMRLSLDIKLYLVTNVVNLLHRAVSACNNKETKHYIIIMIAIWEIIPSWHNHRKPNLWMTKIIFMAKTHFIASYFLCVLTTTNMTNLGNIWQLLLLDIKYLIARQQYFKINGIFGRYENLL